MIDRSIQRVYRYQRARRAFLICPAGKEGTITRPSLSEKNESQHGVCSLQVAIERRQKLHADFLLSTNKIITYCPALLCSVLHYIAPAELSSKPRQLLIEHTLPYFIPSHTHSSTGTSTYRVASTNTYPDTDQVPYRTARRPSPPPSPSPLLSWLDGTRAACLVPSRGAWSRADRSRVFS